MKRVLFVCSQNKLRSPTAEHIFSYHPDLEVASAGLNNDAVTTVSPELVEWADVIFVMERAHRNKLLKKFKKYIKNQKVICLDIPDEYEYMSPALVEILKETVPRLLGIQM